MKILHDKEGVALIATLILGMIAISFTLTMVYLAREGTRLAGVDTRYQSALQVASGGVDIAVDAIRHTSSPSSYNSTYTFGDYRLTVSVINSTCGNQGVEEGNVNQETTVCLYSIHSEAVRRTTSGSEPQERAVVEALYRVRLD